MPCHDDLDLYVAIGKREERINLRPIAENQSHPAHWMLLVVPPEDTNKCLFIYVKGGPIDYEHSIQHNRRLDRLKEQSKERIGKIDKSDLRLLLALAERVEPKRCQLYVAELLDRMSQRGLIRRQVVEKYQGMIDPSLWTQLAQAGVIYKEAAEIILILAKMYREVEKVYDMQEDACLYDYRVGVTGVRDPDDPTDATEEPSARAFHSSVVMSESGPSSGGLLHRMRREQRETMS
ncbi:hypothetical protein ASPSYDRAFT_1165304 [Aspergillus sydowii CBS 593.65]|uniref:Uncharacterized protein n=1 Tax=Aspergillus sydowii CBS 593.65 TaxID=1036612 RepID=A0A1L9T0A1_9EURO|nr:uncharacterized protein ASPSYDRAFT_1165304 [Aspergillus sydowii CBS 593.65]OJJ52848.1 hypothetical protein ASPSYDRAFT_1165304 [Aspergillus sydowii CBS 593.65]